MRVSHASSFNLQACTRAYSFKHYRHTFSYVMCSASPQIELTSDEILKIENEYLF
jgi:hypothetical protein